MPESDKMHGADRFWPKRVPDWVRTIGMLGWMVAGAAAGIYAVAYVSSKAASILVPLIVAVVIGVVAYPLVVKLQKWNIPSSVGAVLVLLLLILIVVVAAWVTVAGVISQWPQIASQLQAGVASLKNAMTSLGAGGGTGQKVVQEAQTAVGGASKSAVSGVVSSAGSGLSGVISLLFGLFIGAFLLYYVLSDMPTISAYVDSHLGLPGDLGRGVAEDATSSLRGYMRGTTITGAAVAAVIGIGVAVLGVPLAVPIALVTFLTCYIPFFGAIVSGAFAFLIAFGAKGIGVAARGSRPRSRDTESAPDGHQLQGDGHLAWPQPVGGAGGDNAWRDLRGAPRRRACRSAARHGAASRQPHPGLRRQSRRSGVGLPRVLVRIVANSSMRPRKCRTLSLGRYARRLRAEEEAGRCVVSAEHLRTRFRQAETSGDGSPRRRPQSSASGRIGARIVRTNPHRHPKRRPAAPGVNRETAVQIAYMAEREGFEPS